MNKAEKLRNSDRSIVQTLAFLKLYLDEEGYEAALQAVVESTLRDIVRQEDGRPYFIGLLAEILMSSPCRLPYSAEASRTLFRYLQERMDLWWEDIEETIAHGYLFSRLGAVLMILLSMGETAIEELFAFYHNLTLYQKAALVREMMSLPPSITAKAGDLYRFRNDPRPWIAELANELLNRSLQTV